MLFNQYSKSYTNNPFVLQPASKNRIICLATSYCSVIQNMTNLGSALMDAKAVLMGIIVLKGVTNYFSLFRNLNSSINDLTKIMRLIISVMDMGITMKNKYIPVILAVSTIFIVRKTLFI